MNNPNTQLKTSIINYGNGIYAIDQMMVRAFLIVGTNKALLLDTGAIKIDILKYINEITSLPVEVVLTHGDGDHIGNLQNFKKAYINENDIDAVLSHEECKKVELIKIKEKQIFNIGNRVLEVIFTPGHTKGSICLLDKQNKILFSGDTVSYGPIFMFGERRDLSSYLNSLKRLLDLRNKDLFNIVYCCHNLCPIETNTIEDLINCTEGILNKTIEMNNAQMPILSKEPIKICKYNKCAILIN